MHKAGFQLKDAHTGAVTVIQRVGSALNATIHFHILFLDRVYVARDNGTPRFHRVKAPDRLQREVLVPRISGRVGRCLERLGVRVRATESAWLNLQSPADDDAMTHLLGSSVT